MIGQNDSGVKHKMMIGKGRPPSSHLEPCAGTREGAGEASVAASVVGTIEHRKFRCSGMPSLSCWSKAAAVAPYEWQELRSPRCPRIQERTYARRRDLRKEKSYAVS